MDVTPTATSPTPSKKVLAQRGYSKRYYTKNRAKVLDKIKKKNASKYNKYNKGESLQDKPDYKTQSDYENSVKSWDETRELERGSSNDPRLDTQPHLRSTHSNDLIGVPDIAGILAQFVMKPMQPYDPKYGPTGKAGKRTGKLHD